MSCCTFDHPLVKDHNLTAKGNIEKSSYQLLIRYEWIFLDLSVFSLPHAPGNREAWTPEPSSDPFCLSSLISSLSSTWSEEAASEERDLDGRSTSQECQYQKKSFLNKIRKKTKQIRLLCGNRVWLSAGCHHRRRTRLPINRVKPWWRADWFSWLAAALSDSDLLAVALKSHGIASRSCCEPRGVRISCGGNFCSLWDTRHRYSLS